MWLPAHHPNDLPHAAHKQPHTCQQSLICGDYLSHEALDEGAPALRVNLAFCCNGYRFAACFGSSSGGQVQLFSAQAACAHSKH